MCVIKKKKNLKEHTNLSQGTLCLVSVSFNGKTQWTPRDLNYVLIRLAECLIMMTIQLKMMCFAYTDEAWGPHTIDRFIITRNLVR